MSGQDWWPSPSCFWIFYISLLGSEPCCSGRGAFIPSDPMQQRHLQALHPAWAAEPPHPAARCCAGRHASLPRLKVTSAERRELSFNCCERRTSACAFRLQALNHGAEMAAEGRPLASWGCPAEQSRAASPSDGEFRRAVNWLGGESLGISGTAWLGDDFPCCFGPCCTAPAAAWGIRRDRRACGQSSDCLAVP